MQALKVNPDLLDFPWISPLTRSTHPYLSSGQAEWGSVSWMTLLEAAQVASAQELLFYCRLTQKVCGKKSPPPRPLNELDHLEHCIVAHAKQKS